MKTIKVLAVVFSGLLFSGCAKQLPDVGGTSAQQVANEWWVMLTLNGSDIYGLKHFKISTYNTSSNDNTIWVDDLKNGYGVKAKASVNYGDLSFASDPKAANLYYDPTHPANFPATVNITSGKVSPNIGVSRAGNVTDSIYMKIEFSDDPGHVYVMSGHARTRFVEDDY